MIPKFKDKKLFEQVFTHRSHLNEASHSLYSNERLEFLGDSILSFVVSSYIYRKYPSSPEGEMTNMRSVLTNTNTLFEAARDLSLGEQLRLSHGEEVTGGRKNKTILANTFEALIGGIYLDQGLDAVAGFIEKTILSKETSLIEKHGLKDPKSKLQEKLQVVHKTAPVYKITKEEGPDHAKLYTAGVYLEDTLLAEGVGSSKQEAEKEAAKNALETLKH